MKKVLKDWFGSYFWYWPLVLIPVAMVPAWVLAILLEPYAFESVEGVAISSLVWFIFSPIPTGLAVSLMAFRKNKKYTNLQKIIFLGLSLFTWPFIFILVFWLWDI